MKKFKMIAGIGGILLIATLFCVLEFQGQEDVCRETRLTFNEPFDDMDYKDVNSTSASWEGDGDVTLGWLGANFAVAEPDGMGARIYVCDAGDFDNDGFPDLIGLDIETDYRLILIRNHYRDDDDDGEDDDGVIFQIDANEVYDDGMNCGPASITVGDYNEDGLLDFFFMKNSVDEFGYTEFVAAMYINSGTAEDPDFYPYYSAPNLDFSSRFMSAGIYINWAADHLCSVDLDGDEDIDVLAISQDKIFLIRNPGVDEFTTDNWEITEISYDQRTGFTAGRGGSSVDAADFDGDGDIDIIGGAVNDIPYLVFYENDGTENFTRKEVPIPEPNCTGTVATSVSDFNHDGRVDIFAATDRWNAGNEARMWFQKNLGIVGGEEGELEFEFRCLNGCNPILPDPHDVDMSAMMDYDRDGDMDVILADANHSGDYFLIINELAPVYNLEGEAWSTVISELDPSLHAVTRIRMLNLDQGVIGGASDGLTIDYYVSNNGGRNWEFYGRYGTAKDDDIASDGSLMNYTNLPWLSFTTFGSQLKWKAILSATEDDMAEYEGASFETPVLERIRFRYAYVERREYSRTSVAANLVDEDGQPVKLIIGGSFYFPGWQGHLRAYDVTSMASVTTSYSELQTVTRPDLSSADGREIVADGVTIRWDAGEILNDRTAASRTIYTAVDEGAGLVRLDFTEGNVSILGPKLGDVNFDNDGLIRFVRGEDRDWKLGDINHSNPVILGPPDDVPILMGSGYEEFVEEWEDRPRTLLVGANDGMLHCFDLLTGEELWAYIPYNLIPKLKNMWFSDLATGARYFARDVYIDGSPVVADVYIDDVWKTVLICGQGKGKGSTMAGGNNYYFALDITDIEDPQPLWEFTDDRMGETWAVPVIGRINKQGETAWAAFMGSGYDNVAGSGRQGNRFYAVDIATGEYFLKYNAGEVNTKTVHGFTWNIGNTLPGSPTGIDLDGDGYLDRVYFGDLDGRMRKIDVSIEFLSGDPWVPEVIYEDSYNLPIITKPEAWKDPAMTGTFPRVYFGTGGDDRAPDDMTYSFVALIDQEDPEVEWYLGDPDTLGLSEDIKTGDFIIGEKVWADPKQANNIIYFSTLTGNIETVDPCQSLEGIGRLYARYVKSVAGTPVGGTSFRSASGTLESLDLEIKTRAAVTIGESEKIAGVRKREVYIQEFDSTIQKLEQPTGALLKIKSWREIFKVFKN